MLRVLHLEDSKEDAFLIAQTVLNDGVQAQFIVVRNRREFERALQNESFDLVLADSGLSGFDGLTAFEMVRSKFPDMVFICVSGLADPAYIQKNLEVGVTDYISKDDLSRLAAMIRKCGKKSAG